MLASLPHFSQFLKAITVWLRGILPGRPASSSQIQVPGWPGAIGGPTEAGQARGQATATTLTADMPVSRQAISKHLLLLQRVGLIDGHREGREVRYEVREQRLADATSALSEVANRWDRRLRAIKQLAEQTHAANLSTSAVTDGDLSRQET